MKKIHLEPLFEEEEEEDLESIEKQVADLLSSVQRRTILGHYEIEDIQDDDRWAIMTCFFLTIIARKPTTTK